jgi:hypothetical protein
VRPGGGGVRRGREHVGPAAARAQLSLVCADADRQAAAARCCVRLAAVTLTPPAAYVTRRGGYVMAAFFLVGAPSALLVRACGGGGGGACKGGGLKLRASSGASGARCHTPAHSSPHPSIQTSPLNSIQSPVRLPDRQDQPHLPAVWHRSHRPRALPVHLLCEPPASGGMLRVWRARRLRPGRIMQQTAAQAPDASRRPPLIT